MFSEIFMFNRMHNDTGNKGASVLPSSHSKAAKETIVPEKKLRLCLTQALK